MDTLDLTTIKDITDSFVNELKAKLESNGTNASGELSKSINGIVKFDGKYLIVSIRLNEYWKYIEYGTNPHFPPVDKIREWIRVKPVLPRPLASGKLPTENQLAYLIGRKISRFGTKPKPFLNNTKEEFDLVGKVYNATLELITKQLEQEINEEL